MNAEVTVIGAGLAGAEAAWQVARRGITVRLYEMRPVKITPAHKTALFAELVCSNSLRAAGPENAVGLLKEEMRRLDSLVMTAADRHRVPAGGALAVDRGLFAAEITQRLTEHPNVEIVRSEVCELPTDNIVVVASGPLTSGDLAASIKAVTGNNYLHFYDAAAPIVTAESIDFDKAFWGSRYDKGDADYVNCPMGKEEYERFYRELISAEVHQVKDFERKMVFEGCMPLEIMAARGPQTLTFGPLKPVGLTDPRTGKRSFAVVQLRKENREGTMFNLVGFQTNLKWSEQQRVFRLIPGLEHAEFIRFGVMHRNSFLEGPTVLKPSFQLKDPRYHHIFFAGQITGVEGYLESAASGLVAGINAARLVQEQDPLVFPAETALGALERHVGCSESTDFQPMNVTWGLFPALEVKIRGKRERGAKLAERALKKLSEFCLANSL
ncbi:MAG TPA: methylenetetrahydrofolate--tRNA-(uracil(54)-C(5))-methyltransferase (FADH(2)-oxidizing) TrmFO [Desulfobacteria bacterium]|nr:methylenetetrahydrofolate--tRNA-(uracil(54)-C(5))-methyltransferase (FADH(2)-oxidizing) TrmFO [Desulfobacteria bacterium]